MLLMVIEGHGDPRRGVARGQSVLTHVFATTLYSTRPLYTFHPSNSLPIHTMVDKEGKVTQPFFPQADRDRPSDVHLNLLRSSGDSSPHKVLFSSSHSHHTLSRTPSEPKTGFNH